MLESASQPVQGTIATVVSLVTLVIVSMGMFSELQDALNLIWEIPSKGTVALWSAIKGRFLSFILVIGTGFLLLVSLLISASLAALGKFVLRALPGPQVILTFVDVAVSLPVITLLFALMFKVLPDGYIAWRDVWLGALASGTLFMIGKWAIGLYLGSTTLALMYGAASSLMVILAWVYYSALIFFLGAEFTSVYAHEYGSRAAQLRGSSPVSR
jgi:membrane protein